MKNNNDDDNEYASCFNFFLLWIFFEEEKLLLMDTVICGCTFIDGLFIGFCRFLVKKRDLSRLIPQNSRTDQIFKHFRRKTCRFGTVRILGGILFKKAGLSCLKLRS
ncbi:hypothetical protein ACKWTF_013637 [Chironomus riparius]